MKRILDFFLASYSNESYIIRSKARIMLFAFFILSLIFIIGLIVSISGAIKGTENVLTPLFIILLVLIVIFTLLLKQKKINILIYTISIISALIPFVVFLMGLKVGMVNWAIVYSITVLNLSLILLISIDIRPVFLFALLSMGGVIFTGVLLYRMKYGQNLEISLTAYLMFGVNYIGTFSFSLLGFQILKKQIGINMLQSDDLKTAARQLEEYNEELEQKVIERTLELEEKTNNILESISYAKVIQDSILVSPKQLSTHVTDCFVIWKPRDIVGGDLYWYRDFGGSFLIGLIDCTGHGVPGAFMTMTVNSILNHIVEEICHDDPGRILQELNRMIKKTFHKGEDRGSDDGFIDQNGGDRDFGFGRKKFTTMLHEIKMMDFSRHKKVIEQQMSDYMGNNLQRDDITVLGIQL